MRLAAPLKTRPVRAEQIILFRISDQLFAVSSASVQDVRGVVSVASSAQEISHPSLRKVRHIMSRGDQFLFVVNGALHFGLPPSPSALVFVMRGTKTALLVDGIEKMTTMTVLQALPQAFCHEEREWYRGLTAIDQAVIPVVKPEGFLTPDELSLLEASHLGNDVSASTLVPEVSAAS